MSETEWKHFPQTVTITRDGLVCKCGHAPMDHDEHCNSCPCIYSRRDLTPSPDGSLAAKIKPDGRLATLYPEVFGFRILIGPADCEVGGDEYIQYNEDSFKPDTIDSYARQMITRFQEWDGYGYPEGWYRYKMGSQDTVYNTPDGKQPGSSD